MIEPLTPSEQAMLNADHAIRQAQAFPVGTCYWQGQQATSPYWRRYWQERKAEDAHDPEPV